MPAIIDLPSILKIADRSDPLLVQNNRSAGEALGVGSEQIASSLSQRWQWRIIIPILNKAQARSLRVTKSKLKGRFNYLRVRMCDQYRISRQDVGAGGHVAVPHSDGAYFSDDSGYAVPAPVSRLTANGDAGDEEISILAASMNGAMTAGVWFSVNEWLYQVDGWVLDGTSYTLQISPPLRADVTAGDEAFFDARSLWILDRDDGADIQLQIGRFGSVQFNLIEPIGR